MKTDLLTVILLLFFTTTYAQIEFEENIIIGDKSAEGAKDVFAADINGDGYIDLLSASLDDDKIAWYKNLDGQGNYGPQQIISTNADYAVSVFAADIDNDGDLDVLSASRGDDKIAWYENIDGNGNFGTQQIITYNADQANDVFAADIDGDNDLDVISASGDDKKVSWYENLDGLGDFGQQQVISNTEDGARSVHVGDADKDGDMDVLVASFFQIPLNWFENLDGEGNFSNSHLIDQLGLPRDVLMADIDGDGIEDILASSGFEIVWFKDMDGQGNYGPKQLVAEFVNDARSIFAADFDGDSDLDIVYASYNDNKIAWFENTDGQGTYSSEIVISLNTIGAESVYATDADGDGDMDVVSASSLNSAVLLFENTNGNGDFQLLQDIAPIADEPSSAYSSDIDGDGDLDILSASTNDDKIAWYENLDGEGSYGQQKIIMSSTNDVFSVYPDDIDGDGDIDVLSVSRDDQKVSWYENIDGEGTFGPELIISTFNSPVDVFSTDIDGDGDTDVVTSTFGSNSNIVWYENINGQGDFGTQQVITSEAGSDNLIFGSDLDGDGDIDVLTCSFFDDKVAWYENIDGQGTFGSQQIISTNADGASDVYASDIDGDGDMDVLSAALVDNKIAWYENIDGEGNYSAEQIISNNLDSPQAIITTDLDGDGDMDVISNSFFEDKLVWFENIDGVGSFGQENIISNKFDGPIIIIADDLDADSDMDLISVSLFDNTIALFKNIGVLSINETNNLTFVVYPNPTKSSLTISSDKSIEKIELYNNLGQLVVINPIIQGNNVGTINISKLQSGIYFIKIKDKSGNVGIRKIIKK